MDSSRITNGVIGDKKVQQKPILEMRKEMEGLFEMGVNPSIFFNLYAYLLHHIHSREF